MSWSMFFTILLQASIALFVLWFFLVGILSVFKSYKTSSETLKNHRNSYGKNQNPDMEKWNPDMEKWN